MKPKSLFLAVRILSGRIAPGRELPGFPAQGLRLGQSVFDLRLMADLAEAIRLSSK